MYLTYEELKKKNIISYLPEARMAAYMHWLNPLINECGRHI